MADQHKELFQKFLERQCTKEEVNQVNKLLEQPGYETMLDRMMEEQASTVWHMPYTSSDLKELIDQRRLEMQQRITPVSRKARFSVMRYAAVAAGMLFLSYLVFWQTSKSLHTQAGAILVEQVNRQGIPVKYVLPDQSVVYLAAGSKLQYPKHFPLDKREIILNGEAFFEVSSRPEQPFIIHSGKLKTEVLGTSFKIKAYKGDSLEVAVASGKVSVSSGSDNYSGNPHILTAGKKVSYDSQTGRYRLNNVQVDELTNWKTGELHFDGLLMSKVAKELERRYGTILIFKDLQVSNYQVSGTFSSKEQITDILSMLAFVGKFQYTESPDHKIFSIYKKDIMSKHQ